MRFRGERRVCPYLRGGELGAAGEAVGLHRCRGHPAESSACPHFATFTTSCSAAESCLHHIDANHQDLYLPRRLSQGIQPLDSR